MSVNPYNLEVRIKALEDRIGRLEMEMQNKIGDSLMKLQEQINDLSGHADQMTKLVGTIVPKVFPSGKPPD
jgi:hypothetical protein